MTVVRQQQPFQSVMTTSTTTVSSVEKATYYYLFSKLMTSPLNDIGHSSPSATPTATNNCSQIGDKAQERLPHQGMTKNQPSSLSNEEAMDGFEPEPGKLFDGTSSTITYDMMVDKSASYYPCT